MGISYRRVEGFYVGDGIDDQTGETQVLVVLDTHPASGHPDRYHFAFPTETAGDLARQLLSDKSTSYMKH